MASRSVPPCDHELRPGITVCLRCQHAERAAKRAKQRQMMARGGAAVLSIAVLGAVGVTAATSLRSRVASAESESQPSSPAVATADSTPTSPDSVVTPPAPGSREVVASGTLAKPIASEPPPGPASNPTSNGVSLVVPVGRTALRDTMVADRSGDTVRVSFDLLLSRTRRPDKFEAIVRSTLPQVFGSAVDSALRALPYGSVARAGDLLETLPSSGFHIPLTNGRAIAVWPETRVGRDGPLVIAYRAVAK